MPHTSADVLDVYEHDSDEPTTYTDVQYAPWSDKDRSGVTVYKDGDEVRHGDIRTYLARRNH